MFLLDTMISMCTDPGLANILAIIKRFMNIIWIAGPILAIVSSVINAVKLMMNPDEKKYKNLFKNSIMALLFLFFLPIIVNVVMGLFDNTFEFAACWNYADKVDTTGQNSGYIDKNKNKNQSILIDPDAYQTKTQSNSLNSVVSGSILNAVSSKIIFVGDSRTVEMQRAVGSNNDVWSCKSSMGLDWLKSTGISNVDKDIVPGSMVVILMGINDLYQVDGYITYLNDLAVVVNSKGAKLYFVSVNPVGKTKDYLNEDIDLFNTKMKYGLSNNIKFIDTNSYLKENGFSSTDGLHYTKSTYNKIYLHIKNNL